MEKNAVKDEIVRVMSQNLGEKLAKAFYDGYYDQTIPIYTHTAFEVLTDLLGPDKARDSLNVILTKYQLDIIHE